MFKQRIHYHWDKFSYSDKRKRGLKSILVSTAAILASLVFALLLTSMVYKDMSLFEKILSAFFTTPFSSQTSINNTIGKIAIFAVAATSFLIASKCGLFNIGISGQMLLGAAIATIVAQHMASVPNGLSQIILLLISVVSAMIVAGIIGMLKAYLNVNEVVSSIMFNWIIYFIATFLLAQYCSTQYGGLYTQELNSLGGENATTNLVFWMPDHSSWLPLLILMICVVVFAIVMLGFTTFGKKIINTGMSVSAAKYAGYNTKVNQIYAMLISGAVAGVLGVMVYMGNSVSMPITVAAKTLPQEGYTGISVGLIAMSNPIGVLPISVLFGMIDASKTQLATNLSIDPAMADAIFGIVVYGAAIISLFYFIVPFKWYLRIFKGKAYADHYDKYVDHVTSEINRANSALYYLRKIRNSKLSKKEAKQMTKLANVKFEKYGIHVQNIISNEKFKDYEHEVFVKYLSFKKDAHKKFMTLVSKTKTEYVIARSENDSKKGCT